MADNAITPNLYVNPQVTDSVTSNMMNVIGMAPAQAMGVLYQGVASTANLAIQNAQSSSQQLNQIGQAVTSVACERIMKMMG
ncbi:RebB family R body protein [Caedibacter taeniospiralis]|uniref:RebD n=1 Tax=Caedibacter taeniospiralis TaxID=28907 RepID=Q6TFI3_CAETA|nr:RebB family R body protein [Caedibacter taeniospiralis]AAR87075.1 RebD [Caedibacter taeniospiralis]